MLIIDITSDDGCDGDVMHTSFYTGVSVSHGNGTGADASAFYDDDDGVCDDDRDEYDNGDSYNLDVLEGCPCVGV